MCTIRKIMRLDDKRRFIYDRLEGYTPEGKRKYVFEDTKRRFNEREYLSSSFTLQTIQENDCNDELLQSTVKEFDFSDKPDCKDEPSQNTAKKLNFCPPPGFVWFPAEKKFSDTNPIVSIIDKDCIDVTKAVSELYPEDKVAMLNMANSEKPGGYYLSGILAQEESIFLRTNIYKFLDPECTSNTPDAKHKHYPLPVYGGLYVPNVLSIRRGEGNKYRLCCPAHINVICVAGLDMREYGMWDTEKIECVKNKIRSIFRIALENEVTVLVLGALGCGAFDNPPDDVARSFNEVIQEVKGLFKAVVFSILPSPESPASVFEDILEGDENLKGGVIDSIREMYDPIFLNPGFPPQQLVQSSPSMFQFQASCSSSQSPEAAASAAFQPMYMSTSPYPQMPQDPSQTTMPRPFIPPPPVFPPYVPGNIQPSVAPQQNQSVPQVSTQIENPFIPRDLNFGGISNSPAPTFSGQQSQPMPQILTQIGNSSNPWDANFGGISNSPVPTFSGQQNNGAITSSDGSVNDSDSAASPSSK